MSTNRIWHLLGRKFTGEATLEELQELEQVLLSNPGLSAEVELHTAYFDCVIENDLNEADNAWAALEQRLEKEFPKQFGNSHMVLLRSRRRYMWMGMATLLAVAALSYGLINAWSEKVNNRVAQINSHNSKVAAIPGKDRKRVVLCDGTTVWLNANSKITYDKDFGITNRDMYLSGEAFFDVAHNAQLPMVVHAHTVDIKVKGTAFNVRSYPGDKTIEASLIRGVIELYPNGNAFRKLLLKPNEKVTITLDALNSQPGSIPTNIDIRLSQLKKDAISGLIPEVAWIENKLMFVSERFSTVAEKMSRWYNTRIIVADPSLAEERFTGFFEDESLTAALAALQMTFNFSYQIDKNGLVTIEKNKK